MIPFPLFRHLCPCQLYSSKVLQKSMFRAKTSSHTSALQFCRRNLKVTWRLKRTRRPDVHYIENRRAEMTMGDRPCINSRLPPLPGRKWFEVEDSVGCVLGMGSAASLRPTQPLPLAYKSRIRRCCMAHDICMFLIAVLQFWLCGNLSSHRVSNARRTPVSCCQKPLYTSIVQHDASYCPASQSCDVLRYSHCTASLTAKHCC